MKKTEIKPYREVVQDYLEQSFIVCDGSVSETARLLKVNRRFIYRRLDVDGLRKQIGANEHA